MPHHKKASDEDLIASYNETGSVWETAKRFGMCGQSVHERLVKLGVTHPINVFNDADRERLKQEYELCRKTGRIQWLAASMGRTRQFICRKARELGLTSYTSERTYNYALQSRLKKEWLRNNAHPKGMLGKKHTSATLETISSASIEAAKRRTPNERAMMTDKSLKTRIARYGTLAVNTREKASWKAGWREIDGKRIYFRSRWEYNYAIYLQFRLEQKQIQSWEHEPKTFWFESIRRGCRSYLPDFRVVLSDGSEEFHEVKGWMDDRSKTKLRRMAKYYPKVVIRVLDGAWFKKNVRGLSCLPGWEKSK